MSAVVCAEKSSAAGAGDLRSTTPQHLEWTGCMLPLHVHCMLCMCVAHISSPAVGTKSVLVCMLVVFASCMCVCIFAARPEYKRGHRKTASFGTILDIPKIVVTGITGPLGFLVTGWKWLGCACGLLCSDMALSCVSLYMIPTKIFCVS